MISRSVEFGKDKRESRAREPPMVIHGPRSPDTTYSQLPSPGVMRAGSPHFGQFTRRVSLGKSVTAS